MIGTQTTNWQTCKSKPPYSALPIHNPSQSTERPAKWWDSAADKSLIVGCYKHGYENYDQMRTDPALSFITSCPPPSQNSQNKIVE